LRAAIRVFSIAQPGPALQHTHPRR
jgi:hypothetical protein